MTKVPERTPSEYELKARRAKKYIAFPRNKQQIAKAKRV